VGRARHVPFEWNKRRSPGRFRRKQPSKQTQSFRATLVPGFCVCSVGRLESIYNGIVRRLLGGGGDFYLIPALPVAGPETDRLVYVFWFAGRVDAQLASVDGYL
jgi:hypothetical protein